MGRTTLSLALCLVPCAVGCGTSDTPGAAVAEAQEKPVAATTPPQKLLAAYLAVQSALAKDDLAAAKKAFARVADSATAAAVSDEKLRSSLAAAAREGTAVTALPAARHTFVALSDGVLAWLRSAGNPLPQTIHVAHCPMAEDNKGARWLQRSDKIENPYFGSEMFRCGSVEAKAASGQKPK